MAVMSHFLLLLIVAVLSCEGQLIGNPPPLPTSGVQLYNGRLNTILPDFSMVNAADFSDADTNGDDINDGLWCQSANNINNVGTWYYNGAPVTTDDAANFLHAYNDATGQVGLLRDGGLSGIEGLYTCIILDEFGVNQTLAVALYRTASYNSNTPPAISGSMMFSLLSTRDVSPPLFTLSYTVTTRPPTTVTCTVNGAPLSIDGLDRTVVTTTSVDVTVTISNTSGSYQCTVQSTVGPAVMTDALTITTTGAPTDVMAERTELAATKVTWSAPASNDPAVEGYEVFYDDNSVTVDSDTTSVNIPSDQLLPNETHDVFVVAYSSGDTLPSESINAIIYPVVTFNITTSGELVVGATDTNIICTVTIDVPIDELQIALFGDVINRPIEADPDSDSVTLAPMVLLTQNAGIYICGASVFDNTTMIGFNVSETYTLNISIPSPEVLSNITASNRLLGRTFESGSIFLSCRGSYAMDDDEVVTVNWFGPNGLVDGSRYTTELSLTDDDSISFYDSVLTISDLSLAQDDGTQYYCVVEVSVNDTLPQAPYIIPGTAISDNITVTLEAVPVPDATIELTGAPVINNMFTLTCDVTIGDNNDLLDFLTISWLFNGSSTLPSDTTVSDVSSTSIILTFNSVSMDQEGVYTCVASLDITDVPMVTSDEERYIFATLDDPLVMISDNGDSNAGSVYTINCEATVVVLEPIPVITWYYNDNEVTDTTDITITQSTDSFVTTSSLQFSPLTYTHAGDYICDVVLNVSNVSFTGMSSDTFTVIVQIPTPGILITSVNTVFYQGVQEACTCVVTLTPPIPPFPNVTVVWLLGDYVITDGGRVAVTSSNDGVRFNSTITVSPLNTTDSGLYTCNGTIVPDGSFTDDIAPYVIGNEVSTTVNVSVNGLPVPTISLTPTGSGVAGEGYTLDCTVDVLDNLYNAIVTVNLTRVGDSVVLASTDGSGDVSTSHSFDTLATSDAGMYSCIVNIYQPDISYDMTYTEYINVNVTIPVPTVSVMTYPSDAVLLTDTYIDIDCTATISDAIDTEVDIVPVWTQDGGASLDNTSAITISPVTNVSSTVYRSRLRINQLMADNDNDAFQCTVTIQPLTPYITGSSGNNSLTLSVAVLDEADFRIVLDIPSAPTAGEAVTLSCTIVPPDRFVLDLTTLLWAYDAAGTQRVDIINPDATLGPLVKESDGNFARNITLDPLMTSDARRYFCDYSTDTLNDDEHTDLTVQIPSPDVSISRSPSSGPIYESTVLNLTCTATVPSVVDTAVSAAVVWTNTSSGSEIADNDYLTFSLPQQVETNAFESTLMFDPVDIDNVQHGGFNSAGNYECQITVSDSSSPVNGEILDGVGSNDTSFTVDVLPPLGLSISAVGSSEVGQSLYITCTVTVVEGLVVQPTVMWTKMDDVSMGDINDLNIPNITVIEGGVTNVTIMLNPVKFEHRGMYYCMGMFNVTGITNDAQDESDTYNLTVNFPPVSLTISQSYTNTLYSGTPLDITCDLELPVLVDIPVVVSNQWTTTDDANIPSADDTTITDGLTSSSNLQHTATLSFYPLNTTDSRGYQCNVMIVANDTTGNDFVNPFNVTNSTSIVVEVLPIPTVDIATSGNEVVGDTFMLTCTVGVVDRLIVEPDIIWTKEALSDGSLLSDDKSTTISVASVRNGNVLSLNFTSLNTSDAAIYTCTATLDITQINVTMVNDSYTDITLQIPDLMVDISLSRDNDILAGSPLTITCTVDVDDQVDTPIYVNIEWTMSGSPLTSNDRITVDGANETDFNQYSSQVIFSTLSSTYDPGTYNCTVNVTSDEDYVYVEDANVVEESIAFDVNDPMIGNFTVMPDSFLGLETGCPDADDYDNVTLTCTASKPSLVVPPLMVRWIRGSTDESQPQDDAALGSVTMNDDGTFVTNTLSFPTSMANDSATYVCYAALNIPDSNIIMINGSSNVTFRAESLPNVPVVMNVSVTATTATISYLITAIAYTPERYRIQYVGLELQPYFNDTNFTYGSLDITLTNQLFTVTLTGLEEANTYNFTVVAVNCLGNTSTNTMNFTTLPTLPVGEPLNCNTTTFLPHSTSLSWWPPVRALQNGMIQGYYLNCTNSAGGVVSGTDPTQASSNTMFTIPVLMPFTNYTCQLASINEVGEGPSTTCQFMTAQDTPDTPPNQFTSTPDVFDVLFTWEEPVTPNGIIVSYTITITNINTSVTTTSITEEMSFMLAGFEPYQNYIATVTAATIVGDGPPAETTGRTEPHVSTPVTDLTLTGAGNNTLTVSWGPPEMPNGYISNYTIAIVNNVTTSQNDIFNVSASLMSTNIMGLSPGVPYYVTVYPVNEVGRGMRADAVGFTVALRPEVAPSGVNVTRSPDGTVITVTWEPITLEQARGFFNYSIDISPVNSRRRQSMTATVPSDQTSFTQGGLDPSLEYRVTIGAEVVAADGSIITGPSNQVDSRSPFPPEPTDNTTTIIIAVVVVVVVLVVLVLVVIVIFVWYRRRGNSGVLKLGTNKRKHKDLFELVEPTTPTATTLRTLDEPPEDFPAIINGGGDFTAEPAVATFDEDTKEKKSEGGVDEEMILERMQPITKLSFQEHVQRMHQDSDKGFENEYKSVPMQNPGVPYDISNLEPNKCKNRFANIFPYDFSRIKLKEIPDTPGSDYINACTIDGYNRKDCYIAAQGPLPTTIDDFWRMIWECKLTNLVMLTGIVEGGKKKCEQYWPDKVGDTMTVSGIQISNTSVVPFSDYVIRNFSCTKESEQLDITHFHFTSWPDHGVPQFATSLIGFIRRVQKGHDKDKGVPLLVHCSAGVGRTGTFIMLDSMMDRLKHEDTVNVYEFLRQMRSKRMYMVQTLAQYVFIHDALAELITCGETDITATNLRARVNKMHKIVPGKNVTGFQDQFQLLDQVCYTPTDTAYSDAMLPVNNPKNRYPDKLPLNLSRPRLRPDGSSGSDYINASFVDGYKHRNSYIVTQGVLKNTVEDFWRMIVEFKSHTIVMLCNGIEEGQEKCYMYWPTKEGEPVEYGRMKVVLQSEAQNGDFVVRRMLVSNERGNKQDRDVAITQFHYTLWPEHGHPKTTASIIEMIDLITKAQMNTGNKAITVMCNDGVGRSGGLLCIHSQLERLKTEGDVDFFKYLKGARTRRVGLLSELDHYVFCHEVLADYVESFDPYANFKNV